MMRRSAGFHADEARRQLLKEWQNVPALELTANDYITCRVNCVDLKNRLSDIETNCRDRLHVWLLRIVGALNSTHFHGTAVPVEEPSTASKADSCTAASALSGMLAIRLRSGGRRPQQTDSQRALILVHSACQAQMIATFDKLPEQQARHAQRQFPD